MGVLTALSTGGVAAQPAPITATFEEFPVPAGQRPHDVWPALDGGVWYTAQGTGELGWLDPRTGETRRIPLGRGSAPHGVVVGADGAAWVTDSGLNAIVRVDPATYEVTVYRLPGASANLNTATFDHSGAIWFTGQSGFYGRLNPGDGTVQVFEAPRGRGPYGITAAAQTGQPFYASLAGSHIAAIDVTNGMAFPIDPPTPAQGARRIWADVNGGLWVSEWNAGQLAHFDTITGSWREWPLPGQRPTPYAVYVDERGYVWLSDWSTNALVRFDPASETFESYELPTPGALVRQIAGRPGEVWAAESARDRLVVLRVQ